MWNLIPTPASRIVDRELQRWQDIRALNSEARNLLCSDRPMFTIQQRLMDIEAALDELESYDAEPNH